MATYVNNLRLKEIATGDESGTWGTSTNTNLELIGEALGYSTEASFGSDADATTTIADGGADPARALYFKVTSGVSLTATRTLTIAPNTVSKVWIIENATSGSQSINISQGSGANVTVPNGGVKIIYTDGAGAGAAVVDCLTNVDATGTLDITGNFTSANLYVDDDIGHNGDSDTYLSFESDSLDVYLGGTRTANFTPGISTSLKSANITQNALTSTSNSVAWDAKNANAYYATTENTTIAQPTDAVEGAIISIEIAQGGTPYTVAWNTGFEFAASTAPTVTATANKTDIFSFRYNGSVWQEIGRVQNLAQT